MRIKALLDLKLHATDEEVLVREKFLKGKFAYSFLISLKSN